ncbi:MAG: peptide deformylase [Prochlorotrichaceae cyanobacterium]
MPATIAVEKKKLPKAPLSVHLLGDRTLRQTTKRVSKVDDGVRQLIRQMLQTMYSKDGIGLAAPQVGVHKQILVVDVNFEEPTTPPLIMFNPVIQGLAGDPCDMEEGCISIPNVFMNVTRPELVQVAYKDDQGRPQVGIFNGLVSRVIQHEIDHLEGVLFVDRIDDRVSLSQNLAKHKFSINAVKPLKK